MRVPALLPVTAAVALAAAAPAGAQTVDVEVVGKGLDNPRHVAVAPNGDIYVAESGRGGPTGSPSCFDSAEGPACTGATGAVTRISRDHGRHHGRHRARHSRHGEHLRQERIATGLASFAPADGGHAIGPHGIFVTGHSVLVTNGGPTAPTRGTPPVVVLRDPTLVAEDPVSALYGTLLEIRKHGRIKQLADIWRFEHDNNPDAQVGNPLIDSNPVDVLASRGRYIVADAGGNSLLRVKHHGSIRVLSLFPNIDTPGPGGAIIPMNAVPTGVVSGPDGAYYMSQLTGFPFPVGGAKVFRVDPRSGEYTTYAGGFTNAMDLAFGRDGTLYVLEIDSNSLLVDGDEGGIWAVPPGGGTPERIELPAGTLTEPGGIAVGRHGDLYVTNHATAAGTGEVLKISLD
jgi:hypothetical protein